MAPLLVLLVTTILARLAGISGVTAPASGRAAVRLGVAVMFIFTGVTHFSALKHDYAAMVPPPFTGQLWVIYLTGLLQVAGAAGLLARPTRRLAGIGLFLLLLGLFPANVYAAIEGVQFRGGPPTEVWLRGMIQVVFLVAVWWSAVARAAQLDAERPPVPSGAGPTPSYRHAHWYFLAALAAIVAGFWPSFFRPLGTGDAAHSLHGVTATLWVVALAVQSWLMSRGLVTWHRRVAYGALLLLPVLVASALLMVAVMFANPEMPPFLPPLLAFIDLPSIAFLLLLVALALRNVRTPAAHKRFMSATVLVGFPPALTRLYARVGAPSIDFMTALHGSFVTVEVILVALIVADRRAGERRLAYPLSLAFFVLVHALMLPVGGSDTWGSIISWYAALPIFA